MNPFDLLGPIFAMLVQSLRFAAVAAAVRLAALLWRRRSGTRTTAHHEVGAVLFILYLCQMLTLVLAED